MTLGKSQVKVSSSLLTINKFAQLCRTTPRTIRFYDQMGLIKPAKIDSWNGYRFYDPFQAKEFFKIRLMQNFHVPLNKVKGSLRVKSPENFLEERIKEAKTEVEEKEKEIKFLNNIKNFLFAKDSNKSFKKEIFGPYILLCEYLEKGRYDEINSHIYKLRDLAKKLKIAHQDKQMTFYWDPVVYKPKDTRLEICLVLKGNKFPKINLPKGYNFRKFPKIEAKSYSYKGPFDYIALIYQKIHEKHGYILKPEERGWFDIHVSGPWNKKSSYDHVTKIAFNNSIYKQLAKA
ncbi:MerR family DNA-binding transcriptional regulator [Candidatus Daviesbacteria bacterium]|nr:MerR family DNA-binding transcriptional regulator [Candidatus Daviesbacteria bacterium]